MVQQGLYEIAVSSDLRERKIRVYMALVVRAAHYLEKNIQTYSFRKKFATFQNDIFYHLARLKGRKVDKIKGDIKERVQLDEQFSHFRHVATSFH